MPMARPVYTHVLGHAHSQDHGAEGLTFKIFSTVKTEVKPMSKYPRIWGQKHQSQMRFG